MESFTRSLRLTAVFVYFFVFFLSPLSAQEWSGSTNLEGDLYRFGRVGIGTDAPRYELHVKDGDDDDTAASLFVQPKKWSSVGDFGEVRIGDPYHYLRGEFKNGMTLYDYDKIRFRVGGSNAPIRMMIAYDGRIGMGTDNPQHSLHIRGNRTIGIQYDGPREGTRLAGMYINGGLPFYGYKRGDQVLAYHYLDANNNWKINLGGKHPLVVNSEGRVGINTELPAPSSSLHVNGNLLVNPGKIYLAKPQDDSSLGNGLGLEKVDEQHMTLFSEQTISFTNSISKESKVFIDLQKGYLGVGTATPTTALQVKGSTTTNVLIVTGGADIAEPFQVNEEEELIREGSIVVIDEKHEGQLKVSQQAYDKKVIGIISGANGVNPGLVLSQEDVLGGGENVAISGRVYVKANASNGPIEAGDFLTTSSIKGEAMRVGDFDQARGAIIGKAMGRINTQGYVLVFVSLQ